MTLLIYSFIGDVHADAVAWAYREQVCPCDIVDYGDFPTRRFVTASISDSAAMAVVSRQSSNGLRLDHSSYRTVWNRRAGAIGTIPGLDEKDVPIVERIGRRFLDEVRELEAPRQTWVNPRLNQLRADNKLFQLRLARELGFRIPETIVSNDPAEIRDFVGRHDAAIVKATRSIVWDEGGEQRVVPTSEITLDHLRQDLPIIACPMIYQERVEKAFELRVAVFGSELVACKLDTQRQEATRVDCRVIGPQSLNVDSFELQPTIADQIRKFMRRAGLLHGSFDFAVSRNGDLIFFEVNEQGQTLWAEECNPEIRILDRLVSFLENPTSDFIWDERRRVSMGDWINHAGSSQPGDVSLAAEG